MDGASFAELVHQWAYTFLAWVGFGTLTGLLAKTLLPGRDQGGPLATLLVGICGTVVGCGVLAFWIGHRVSPLSTFGFVAATGGSLVLLFFHRLLAGGYFLEAGTGFLRKPRRRRTVVHTEE